MAEDPPRCGGLRYPHEHTLREPLAVWVGHAQAAGASAHADVTLGHRVLTCGQQGEDGGARGGRDPKQADPAARTRVTMRRGDRWGRVFQLAGSALPRGGRGATQEEEEQEAGAPARATRRGHVGATVHHAAPATPAAHVGARAGGCTGSKIVTLPHTAYARTPREQAVTANTWHSYGRCQPYLSHALYVYTVRPSMHHMLL